jgi:hypothetical protein
MLPTEITAKAFHSQSDEYAWQRADVLAAIEAISSNALAVLGGEVWIIQRNEILALPPLKTGGNAVIGWDTREKAKTETWEEFVDRTAQETIAAIDSLKAEDEVKTELADKVYYNIVFVNEAEYAALGKDGV